jgi:glycosyltransferase involved in cell wall biosynthesis
MNVLVLPRYGVQGASSRLRFYQFLPSLNNAGIETVVVPLIENEALLRKYERQRYDAWSLIASYAKRIRALLVTRRFDLAWIEKEALPWLPAWLEKALIGRLPYALDFDDAVFHNYDRNRVALVRALMGTRIDKLMAGARVVVAGNSYLAARARRAGASRTQILPTVVDIGRYSTRPTGTGNGLRIVWIGSPSTVRYLSILAEPLARLARTHEFTLRVIGDTSLQMPGVDVETVAWSEDTEAAEIRECDIGVMPLLDNEWELGKCGYKLIQYMACGLPTVASPVGANCDVTIDGFTGYFARDETDWTARLRALLEDESLRRRLGVAGRARVEQHYSLQQVAPRLTDVLREAGT